MRIFFACLGLALSLALPASAQEEAPADDEGPVSEGMRLFEEGTRLLLRGLMDEIGPAMEGLRGVLDDLDAYHPPEVLPNGDIILRRKVPLEPSPDGTGDVEVEI